MDVTVGDDVASVAIENTTNDLRIIFLNRIFFLINDKITSSKDDDTIVIIQRLLFFRKSQLTVSQLILPTMKFFLLLAFMPCFISFLNINKFALFSNVRYCADFLSSD